MSKRPNKAKSIVAQPLFRSHQKRLIYPSTASRMGFS